jgi:hypothetical protein
MGLGARGGGRGGAARAPRKDSHSHAVAVTALPPSLQPIPARLPPSRVHLVIKQARVLAGRRRRRQRRELAGLGVLRELFAVGEAARGWG